MPELCEDGVRNEKMQNINVPDDNKYVNTVCRDRRSKRTNE